MTNICRREVGCLLRLPILGMETEARRCVFELWSHLLIFLICSTFLFCLYVFVLLPLVWSIPSMLFLAGVYEFKPCLDVRNWFIFSLLSHLCPLCYFSQSCVSSSHTLLLVSVGAHLRMFHSSCLCYSWHVLQVWVCTAYTQFQSLHRTADLSNLYTSGFLSFLNTSAAGLCMCCHRSVCARASVVAI